MVIENEELTRSFVENGYFVLKNAICTSIIDSIKQSTLEKLHSLLKPFNANPEKLDLNNAFLETIKYIKQHDVQEEIMRYLMYKELLKQLYLQPKLLEKLIYLLGSDLAYETETGIVANIKDSTDNYVVKKFHQEYWSGVGIYPLQMWIPIALEPDMGQIQIIKGSHLWGHIPHQNREPIWFPEQAERLDLQLSVGDMVGFHPLTLHKTIPNNNPNPRFALAGLVKNFMYPNTGFEELTNWEIFHLSPISIVKKKLGNPQLSPFRTYGGNRDVVRRVFQANNVE